MHVAPTLLSPAGGETGVTTSPMFRWSVIQDVVSTDFELASDAAFLNIIDTQTFAAQQTYVYADALDLENTYHWRVRGHGGTGIDAWTTPWSEGIFFTEGPPPTPIPAATVIMPADIVIQEGDEITPGWIWALIVIGAVLAVVVIVLIMRTRRPV
jgi:hypothetical protein